MTLQRRGAGIQWARRGTQSRMCRRQTLGVPAGPPQLPARLRGQPSQVLPPPPTGPDTHVTGLKGRLLRSDCDCSMLMDWFRASSWGRKQGPRGRSGRGDPLVLLPGSASLYPLGPGLAQLDVPGKRGGPLFHEGTDSPITPPPLHTPTHTRIPQKHSQPPRPHPRTPRPPRTYPKRASINTHTHTPAHSPDPLPHSHPVPLTLL